MLGQKGLEPGILLHDSVALAGGVGEDFLESEDFLLERFDVHLLAFAVCSLRLSIELLPPSERGFAVWFRASALRRLAIYVLDVRAAVEGGSEGGLLVPLVCFFSLLRFFNSARLLSGLMSPLPELAAENGLGSVRVARRVSLAEGTHCYCATLDRVGRQTAFQQRTSKGRRVGGWVKKVDERHMEG